MAIVAYGYGLDVGLGTNVLVNDILVTLEAEPVVVVDDEVTVVLDDDDFTVVVDDEIVIEVE